MSSLHFGFKRGGVGRARKHAAYVIGAEKYAAREDVVDVASGNMPVWAASDPLLFWDAADNYERANGRTYHEFEMALPRELTEDQAKTLVEKWIEETLGGRHPWTYGIHNKIAEDGQPNTHVHLMFSDRLLDGIERPPELFFRRAASRYRDRKTGELQQSDPATAGAGKDRRWNDRQIVKQLRTQWEGIANNFLSEHGHQPRIDLRPNAERGLGEPEPKIGPAKRKNDHWRDQRKVKAHTIRKERCRAVTLRADIQSVKRELRASRRERARQEVNSCLDTGRHSQSPHRSPLKAMRAEDRRGRTLYRWEHGAAAGLAALVDRGNRITLAGKPSTQKARALVDLAKAKGWTGLILTGSDEFKRMAVREALREGLRISNPELADLVKEEKSQMHHHRSRTDLARQWLMTTAPVNALEAAQLSNDPERLVRLFDSSHEAQRWALIQRQRAEGVPDRLLGFQIDREAPQTGIQGVVRHVAKHVWVEPNDRPGHVIPIPPSLPVRPGQRVVVQPNGEIILPERENTPRPR